MTTEPAPAPSPPNKKNTMRAVKVFFAIMAAYFVIAYVIVPFGWKRYAKDHPSFDDNPRITKTGDGHPGDALNVSFTGTEAELKAILAAAKWHPADPLGLKSDLEIAEATVLKREYDDAPVSNLFLYDRKEDLAYEQPVGNDPRKRHHVRFWRSDKVDHDGRPVWMGSAIFDDRVGISRTTGQITHHTAADIDVERDFLFDNLKQTTGLSESYYVDDFHTQREGKNGGGDPWRTDGRLAVGIIAVDK